MWRTILIVLAVCLVFPGGAGAKGEGDELPNPIADLPGEVAVDGTPPLTYLHLEFYHDMINYVFEGVMTPDEEAAFDATIIAAFESGSEEERADLLSIEQAWPSLLFAQDLATHAEIKGSIRENLVQQAEGMPDEPGYQVILALAGREAEGVLADGKPPLTTADLAGYIESIRFYQHLATGQPVAVTEEDIANVAAQMVRMYEAGDPQTRFQLTHSDMLWNQIKYSWCLASMEEKIAFRDQFLAQLAASSQQTPAYGSSGYPSGGYTSAGYPSSGYSSGGYYPSGGESSSFGDAAVGAHMWNMSPYLFPDAFSVPDMSLGYYY